MTTSGPTTPASSSCRFRAGGASRVCRGLASQCLAEVEANLRLILRSLHRDYKAGTGPVFLEESVERLQQPAFITHLRLRHRGVEQRHALQVDHFRFQGVRAIELDGGALDIK